MSLRANPLLVAPTLPDQRRNRLSAAAIQGVVLPSRVNWTAEMTRSTDQAITTSTETKVLFDTRVKDVTYEEASSQPGAETCDLTNDEIHIRRQGRWRITFFGVFAAAAGGTVRSLRFFLNGVVMTKGRFSYERVNSALFLTTVWGSVEHDFVLDDKIDARVFQDSGGNLSLVAAEGIAMTASWEGL